VSLHTKTGAIIHRWT